MTARPNYASYNLLDAVNKGDIIYEAAGGSGITGHIAIVEGTYYDAYYRNYYIRLIESIGYVSGIGQADGVCRGVLDDERLNNREGTILRVKNASDSQISAAISFCISQIGKNYSYDAAKDTSSSQANWYCSELVWAAYKNQGIDIENNTNVLGVLPAEIANSSNVQTVNVSTFGTPMNVSISLNDSTNVTVSWSAVSGATEYDVYYSSSYNGTFYYLASLNTTQLNTTVATGATRYYRIQAIKGTLCGNFSDPVGCTNEFSAPSIVNIYTPSSTSVSLTWNAVQGATSYKVYREVNGSNTYSQIATTTSPTFVNTGLTSGTKYSYKVAAVGTSSTTGMSAMRTKTPTKVLTPQIYFGGKFQSGGALIKWTYIPGATSYSVYLATDIYNPVYTLVGSSNQTFYSYTTTTSLNTYIFQVVANGNGGSSERSDSYYIS